MKKRKKYKLYAVWQMCKVIEVEAGSVEEARSKIENEEILINVDTD